MLERAAERVSLPQELGCCGQAGDRGFMVPELVEAATRPELNELSDWLDKEPEGRCLSACKSCELGLSKHSKKTYESYVAFLLERVEKRSSS